MEHQPVSKDKFPGQALLAGCELGELQSSGTMEVIPLFSRQWDEGFATPKEGSFKTSGYGKMVFSNPTDRYMLVPCHAGYIVKEAAQNHAMSHAALVRPGEETSWDTAMCIQAGQGGFISEGSYEMLLLPYALREKALVHRHQKSYGKLWNAISGFNRRYGLQQRGHLEYFFEAYARQLETFVAEFECLPKQTGALVFFEGRLAGIEKAPSPAVWKFLWQPIIRDCYGSHAVFLNYVYEKRQAVAPLLRRIIEEKEINSLEDLARTLKEKKSRQTQKVKGVVEKALAESFQGKIERSWEEWNLGTVTSRSFAGQIITEEESGRAKYISIFDLHQGDFEERERKARAKAKAIKTEQEPSRRRDQSYFMPSLPPRARTGEMIFTVFPRRIGNICGFWG